MNFKPLLEKFFQDHKGDLSTDKDSIKFWFLNEMDFDVCNAYVHTFINMVASFSKIEKNGKVFTFIWPKIKKTFKLNGAKR